ncbi:MAG: restriction endonuclease subunit S [Candidatus ainarchaeum sp.]|nr:restriction endonuclease subunit S [Candidatus ainarchaeum sp.]
MCNTKYKQTDMGSIPEDWVSGTLEDIAQFKNGRFSPERTDSGKYSVFGSNGIIGLSDEYNSEENTIIIGRVGTYCGCIYFSKYKCWVTDNAIIGLNKINSDFYYLLYLLYYLNLNRIKGGSGQSLLNQSALYSIRIGYPKSKEEQKAIAKILSDLDSKIELNKQMNKTLEEIGKTLFKRWFVDFEFPNEQGKPYKSSGGEMVYNEELKKEIPNGSQIIRLKDQLTFERGIEPGSAIYENSKTENNIRFIRVSDLNNDNSTTFIPLELATSKVIESDVLLSLDASVGIVRIGYNGSFSSGIRKIYDNCNKLSNALIYFLLKSEDIQNTINQYANGTTILHAGKSIEFMNFVIPNEKMLDKFKTQITPIFNQILYNIKENKQLADTRDLLLPKLMSGKIRVKY